MLFSTMFLQIQNMLKAIDVFTYVFYYFFFLIFLCLLLLLYMNSIFNTFIGLLMNPVFLSSVQFCLSVVSDSLTPHESQHGRHPCPSPTPSVHPDPCPSSQWCHPTILSSVIPFSSCPQSFPVSGSFQMSQLFTSGGQSIGVSASISVLSMNTQDWSPVSLTPVYFINS